MPQETTTPRAIVLQETREAIAKSYHKHGGNISAIAREVGITRKNIRRHLEKLGLNKKPLASGSLNGNVGQPAILPGKGKVKRYILTSAQNNTYVHEVCWNNLLALATHYKAEIFVGTYSYNQNAYGKLAVKQGTKKAYDRELWFDERLKPFIRDSRIELGNGLAWCGEMNIIPTANDPLEGLETYSGRKSAVFPHSKIAMVSVATMQGEGVKLNYTTGTVTLRNYIQKKAGLKAEHHHNYGAVIVEVDSNGNWWVRQLEQGDDGAIYDLTCKAENGAVTTGNTVEAITWGDIHATILDPTVEKLSVGKGGMLDTLRPKYQFIHDLLEGVSVNHHAAKNPHDKFKAFLRGYDVVTKELQDTSKVMHRYHRDSVRMIVVDSNHDNWVGRWLREHDYRTDPRNALLFLEAQLEVFRQIEGQNERFHLVEWAMRKFGCPESAQFLRADESFTICDKQIECGMHGHLGTNGARGTPANLKNVGRKAITAHTHCGSINNGLYTAGTSTDLNMGYNHGPSGWNWTHVVTYPNAKRTLVTLYANKWKA
jgi:hypothetical protein